MSAKTVLLVRLQGFEPWTPWLRVRCSTNWAKNAYLIVCLSFVSFLKTCCIIRYGSVKVNTFFYFFYFYLFYFLYLHLMQFCSVFFLFLTANFWSGLPDCWCCGLHCWDFVGMNRIFFFSSFLSPLSHIRQIPGKIMSLHLNKPNIYIPLYVPLFLIYYMKTGRSVSRSAWKKSYSQ